MSELRSNRRRAAQEELGFNDVKELSDIERSIEKEERRKAAKERKRIKLENSQSYRSAETISKFMDKWHLDAILGFVPGGMLDFITQFLILPYIYIAAFKIRSIPLTLAVIYNSMRDVAIGLIPFIGWVCDFFNRSFLQNMRLIVGFVEDDKEIIDEVRRKAVRTAILIAVFCIIIYWLVLLAKAIVEGVVGLFS